jgi:solute carrier family 13 (sodium-dependent dicarboxylate transporter), member 2/3/5
MAELELKGRNRTYGLIAGLILFAATLLIAPPGDMPLQAWRVAGIALLMATWWITEAAPIPATALVPLVVFPVFGIAPMRNVAAPYADPIIFLFLGGFVIGIGMQRWALHKRIGLRIITLLGTAPGRLTAGFLISTALLSMWISNSATAIMMLPVAVSVLALYDAKSGMDETSRGNLGLVLLLSVAYGASIGGLGTLIGTPPNALLAAYLAREHGIQIGFAQWMLLGLPLVAIMLLVAWFVLGKLHPVTGTPGFNAGALVREELQQLGPMSPAEYRMAVIFAATAIAWVTRPLYAGIVPGIDDSTIAIAGALALFLLPSGMPGGGRLLSWDDLAALPWGVLLLFGGGLSLADAISTSGLAAWLGAAMGVLADWPALVIITIATFAMIFLTELTSNTASAATFLPIGGALAIGIGIDPVLLTAPLALAASCAFMLPVATPPNAIVFASGRIAIAQMARAGFLINIVGAIVIVAVSYPLAGWLFPR